MDFQFSIYALPLLFTTGVCTLAAAILWRKQIAPDERRRLVTAETTQFLILVLIAGWAASQTVAVLTGSPLVIRLAMYAAVLATLWASMAWFVFALEYTGREEWVTRRTLALLSLLPLIGTVGIATDGVHGLFLVDPILVTRDGRQVLSFGWGPGTWLVGVHAWSYCAATVGLLYKKFVSSRNIYRKIALMNIVCGIVLNVAGFLTLSGLGPFQYLMLGPIAISVVVAVSPLAMVSRRYLRFIPLQRLLSVLPARWRNLQPMARDVIVQQMQSGVVVLDHDNRIVDLNPMGKRMLDAAGDRVVGKRLTEVVDPAVFRTDDKGFFYPDATHGDYRAVWVDTPDGEARCFDVHISPLGSTEDSAGRVALINDVTDREVRKQKLERRTRELERQNEQLEEFAGIVSHDLRNPLSVARGYLEMAEGGDEQALAEVERSLDRMEAIIEDVLTLARQGKSIGDTEPVELEAVARDAWEHVDTERADLVVTGECVLEADRDRLLHLFENLFRNAIQHGGSDVTVTVGGDDEGFFVADDGPGIPADRREDVLESGYTTDDAGTGFGLAIVSRIAEAHGWDVDATAADAGGARFEFRLVDRSKPVEAE